MVDALSTPFNVMKWKGKKMFKKINKTRTITKVTCPGLDLLLN